MAGGLMQMQREDVLRRLEEGIREAGSQRAWAASAGVSAQYVGDIRKGRRAPGVAVLDALGLQRVVSYVPTAEATR